MRFLSVRELRTRSADIWRELMEEREMVVTNNGRPIAILAAVSESNLEESLTAFRRARAEQAVTGLQLRSEERGAGKVPMEEIEEEIRTARRLRER
jgi:antitoxin (DNA-binding transcriptional repressor) of toxin-antitoxin stability system